MRFPQTCGEGNGFSITGNETLPPWNGVGILGGMIWCIGQSFSLIASGKAGAAISYGLGQGATLVSALWEILIWKEFKGAPKASSQLNTGMFILFIIGLGLLIYAGA